MSIINQRINPCLNANASLGIDEACFSIMNNYAKAITLYSYSSECYMVCN